MSIGIQDFKYIKPITNDKILWCRWLFWWKGWEWLPKLKDRVESKGNFLAGQDLIVDTSKTQTSHIFRNNKTSHVNCTHEYLIIFPDIEVCKPRRHTYKMEGDFTCNRVKVGVIHIFSVGFVKACLEVKH